MKKQFGKIFAVLAVAAILVLGIVAGRYWEAGKKPELNSTTVTAQISELSQLSTAELGLPGTGQIQSGRNHLSDKERIYHDL
ncbi:hypothetical protein [Blautia argi]|uniref:hypothetical protein n=1 Tax=Blautia argi TaxID=1912897 RepID=UPI001FA8ECAE|nr:hypothetical protein [Blautia argi]